MTPSSTKEKKIANEQEEPEDERPGRPVSGGHAEADLTITRRARHVVAQPLAPPIKELKKGHHSQESSHLA